MHIGGAHEFPFGRVKLVPAFHGGRVEGDHRFDPGVADADEVEVDPRLTDAALGEDLPEEGGFAAADRR